MFKLEAIGHIGRDAEVREINGRKYAVFSIAVNRGKDKTEWLEVLKYGDNAKLLPYLKKGTKVFIRGDFNAKIYQVNESIDFRISMSVFADELQLVGGAKEENETNSSQAKLPDELPF